MTKITATVDTSPRVSCSIDTGYGVVCVLDSLIAEQLDVYEGGYVVTPTEETQILQTANLKLTDNITINPIPSNYGRITWNGSVLTVS